MKNKISFKKVVSFLIAVVVLICYIWGASEIISKFIKPSAPFEESFGNYKITLADSEIDPNDKNENRIFDNVNKSLFYNEQPEFSGKQILSLYKAENTSNKKDTKEQIKINIDKDIAKDESIEVVRINDKNECKKIDFKIIKETVDDKEQDYLVIDINESCIFGVLIERGEAEHAGAIVLSSIAIIAIIYLFAFILPDLKKKNKGKKKLLDNKGIPQNRKYGNFNKYPTVKSVGNAFCGYESILKEIKDADLKSNTLVLDCYTETDQDELKEAFGKYFDNIFFTDLCALSGNDLREKLMPVITNDRIFGVMTTGTLDDCFVESKVQKTKNLIKKSKGTTLVIGVGAAAFAPYGTLVHCSVARWESQLRFRKGTPNWNFENPDEDPLTKFKIGYFALWRFADKHKMEYFEKYDYFMDTNTKNKPVMVNGKTYLNAVSNVVTRPFRLVPYFDSGVWGGQWMKQVCGLDKDAVNFAWCFDCVPEENSLYYDFNGIKMEMPSLDVVHYKPIELLGQYVYDIFGAEFPIRYDFLDTIDGGNLSLQVHPTKEYINETFNMPYTQDESYYILDAEDDATVYLGVKENIDKAEFFKELNDAQITGKMDVEKFVNKWPAKKHDHFLIPAGTIHCSGKNAMVLEISATPYIFTFKLWDWGRLGLDGKPRPINIKHGEKVLDVTRDTTWTEKNIINNINVLSKTDSQMEEKTGLYKTEPLETRRHTFKEPVLHKAVGSVCVMNLVEGEEAVISSPDNSFEPFLVHYAETFVIPSDAGDFIVSPTKRSKGTELKTIKTYVRKI